MAFALCCLVLVIAACALGARSLDTLCVSTSLEAPSEALGPISESYAIALAAAVCAPLIFMSPSRRSRVVRVAVLGAFAFTFTAAVCARVATSS